MPWRRKWQPTPVFLPGKSHEQRSLVGYSPWSCKEADMTEHTCMHRCTDSGITATLIKEMLKKSFTCSEEKEPAF